ncbi:MAG: Transcription factor Pcc1 [Thermoplasmata archaeon]|jgi:tRNA threonylcarbamoyladenosine modification (KEOPS) complex  Pcc1 subunit|nr:Transcription factor Pcc1 [Thermoplasmata archaeon]
MHHSADLFFELPEGPADAIARALAPEANASEVPKTRADLTREPTGIRIHLEADDPASLRAALNSYLRWIDAAHKAAALAGP